MLSQLLSFLRECWPSLLLIAAMAYLVGSISSAILVTRLFSGTDIRDSGSGNAGATNVLRSQGKLPALLTTVGDLGKSIAAVLLGAFLAKAMNAGYTGSELDFVLVGQYLAGVFCIFGHLYPVYFGFRGGKGVMTTLGMMLILDWRAALICLGLFILLVLLFRMVSLGSVLAVALLPVVTYLFSVRDGNPFGNTLFSTLMTALIALVVIVKHIPNIKRILNGTESRIGSGKSRQ